MKLKEALKRVMALLPKDKNKSFFHKVRFVSSPSAVFVTDGICSSLAYVDSELPDFLCDSSILRKAIKDKGDLSIEIVGSGKIDIFSELNRYRLVGQELASFPVPSFPDAKCIFTEVDLTFLNSVIYSASKTSKNGGWPYVHFTNSFIETNDTIRLARVDTEFPWEGVLPIELFNKWPKKIKEGGFCVDDYFVYFKLDDEYRVSVITKEDYPDTLTATKISDNCGHCVVNCKELLEIVKQATEVSEVNGVLFEFGGNVRIHALGRECVLDGYVGSLKLDDAIVDIGKVSVLGKVLVKSLRNIKSDVVNLIYGPYPEPLVVRGGDTSVYIWPMVNE